MKAGDCVPCGSGGSRHANHRLDFADRRLTGFIQGGYRHRQRTIRLRRKKVVCDVSYRLNVLTQSPAGGRGIGEVHVDEVCGRGCAAPLIRMSCSTSPPAVTVMMTG